MNQLISSFMYYFSRTNKHLKTKTLCQFFFYIEKLLSQHQHDILKKKTSFQFYIKHIIVKFSWIFDRHYSYLDIFISWTLFILKNVESLLIDMVSTS